MTPLETIKQWLEARRKVRIMATPGFWFGNESFGVFVKRLPDLEPLILASEVRHGDVQFICDSANSSQTYEALILELVGALEKTQRHLDGCILTYGGSVRELDGSVSYARIPTAEASLRDSNNEALSRAAGLVGKA